MVIEALNSYKDKSQIDINIFLSKVNHITTEEGLVRVCAYCGNGIKKGKSKVTLLSIFEREFLIYLAKLLGDEFMITHTLCPDCLARELEKLKK